MMTLLKRAHKEGIRRYKIQIFLVYSFYSVPHVMLLHTPRLHIGAHYPIVMNENLELNA